MRTLTTPSLWSRVAALFFFLLGLAPGLRAQTWQWATAAGPTGPGSAHASRSGLDATGNAFVTGYFSGTVSFGSTVLTSVGTDAFVAKLDANGAWLWAVRAGQAVPTGAGTQANGLAVSPDGSVTIAGQFEGTASFGGTSLNSAGSTDMFVAKLSGAGAWQWAIRGGGSGADVAAAVVAHPSGSFLGVAGSCSNGANFGGHIPDFMGGTEALVARVDPAGSWTWAVTAGGTGDDEALDLSVDVANATFQVVGSYIGQGFFSINSGLTILNSNFGSRDAFLGIVQMANPTWAGVSNIGGPGIQRALAVATAVNGDTYVTGTFETTADFITSTLTSSGGATEGFATCLSRATGRFRWSTRIGGAGADAGRAIAVDAAGNATVAGDFAGPATFDTLPLAGSGSSEAFVGRISAAGVAQWLWQPAAPGPTRPPAWPWMRAAPPRWP